MNLILPLEIRKITHIIHQLSRFSVAKLQFHRVGKVQFLFISIIPVKFIKQEQSLTGVQKP
jgi:hypothetical protein